MREMKDSGIEWIGEIPIEWNITLLSALFKEHKVKNIGFSEQNLLSLSYGTIKRKDINNNEGLLPESFETYNVINNGNIVFRLTDLQNDKRSLRTGLCKEKGIITSAYTTLETTNNDDPNYMHYLFHTYDLCKVFYSIGDGVRQSANYADLKKIKVIRPPLSEQKKIAAYLDEKCSRIDEIIEKQQKIIEKLKEYKLSVITEAVTKGLDPNVPMKDSGVEWIGEIPESWKTTKMKYISIAIGDGIHSTPEYDIDGDYYFLNGNSIGQDILVFKENNDKLNYKEYSKYKPLNIGANTILVTLNGATYGKTSFYNGEKVLLGKSAGYITLKDSINKYYVRYYLQSWVAKNIMELSLCGSTIANLSLFTLNNFLVFLPEKDVQEKIVDYLNNKCLLIDNNILKRQGIIDKLIDYKKSLIYEVVTGKKEV